MKRQRRSAIASAAGIVMAAALAAGGADAQGVRIRKTRLMSNRRPGRPHHSN